MNDGNFSWYITKSHQKSGRIFTVDRFGIMSERIQSHDLTPNIYQLPLHDGTGIVKTNKNWRKEIWSKSNGLCAHCGKPATGNDRTVDHVIPKILGGGNDPRNLMPLCKHCNASRASSEIIPETYYRYAAPWAMDELRDYIMMWKAAHTTASGEMTVERYGIIDRPDAPSAP